MLKLIVYVVGVMLMLLMVACSSSNSKPSVNVEPDAVVTEMKTKNDVGIVDETEIEEKETTETKEEETAIESRTLEEMYNDPAYKETFENFESYFGTPMAGSNLENEFEVKGNEFIWIIKFTYTDSESIELLSNSKNELQKELDEATENIKFVEELDNIVGQKGACSMTVRYVDSYNNVLAESVIKAQ